MGAGSAAPLGLGGRYQENFQLLGVAHGLHTHGKHHNAYVTNLNAAIEGLSVPDCINELISDLSKIPEAKRGAVRNNGGGHANHSLFWKITASPSPGGSAPSGALAAAIDRDLGGLDAFKEAFSQAGVHPLRVGLGLAGRLQREPLCLLHTEPRQSAHGG